jgi:hypothetical protein
MLRSTLTRLASDYRIVNPAEARLTSLSPRLLRRITPGLLLLPDSAPIFESVSRDASLPAYPYMGIWRVISVDTDVTNGDFIFQIVP